jgi:hypothetical protein
MSKNARAVDDAFTNLLDVLAAEPDPVLRLNEILRVDKDLRPRLVRAKYEAAYDAASLWSVKDLAGILRMDRGQLKYLVNQHADINRLPSPARRQRQDTSGYLTLPRR